MLWGLGARQGPARLRCRLGNMTADRHESESGDEQELSSEARGFGSDRVGAAGEVEQAISESPEMVTPDVGAHRTILDNLIVGGRLLGLGGCMLAGIGVAGHFIAWPLLTTTLGPTLYVFLAHPKSETARLRSAIIGHGTAIAVALASLAIFGLWTHPSISAVGHASLHQAAAAGLAVGLTLAILQAVGYHHAPAAATALLISTGIAAPGKPLFGLLIGLAVVIALGPVLGKVPFGRIRIAHEMRE